MVNILLHPKVTSGIFLPSSPFFINSGANMRQQ